MILWLVLAGCPRSPGPEALFPPRHLTVLHTNDIHGHFLPERAEWLPGEPEIGGFVRLDQEVRALRAARPKDAVLLLDAGDQLTGTPLTDFDAEGSKGGAMHPFLDLLGYDAWAIGNHEFDKGLDNLAGYTARGRAPALSVNLRRPEGGPLLPRQSYSHVFERAGVKVGVIGVTTEGLHGLMSRKDFARLELLGEVEAVRAEVDRLDPETDLLVVVSHIGAENDHALARAVPGIDLIVGGHSHTRMETAEKEGSTWIVQAGSYNRSLGVVDLVVGDDAIQSFQYQLRDLVPQTATVPPREELEVLADHWRGRIDSWYGEVVSQAPATLTRSYSEESALGRWITDALRARAGADIAFYNGGGLRADLVGGPVTRGSLYACFPFGNEVMRFEMSGADLLPVVLRNLGAEASGKRGWLSVSGLTWTWRLRDGAPEVLAVRVGDEPLVLERTYTVATTSYVAEHWEKHLGTEPRRLTGLGYTDLDAAVDHARKGPVVDPGGPRSLRVQ